MKARIPTFIAIFSTGLLVAGIASAQTQSQPMQQPATTSPTQSTSNVSVNNAGTNAGSSGANSATYNTAKGQVTVNSTMGSTPSTTSPPSFEQLANGKKYISKADANAYPPLANDFEYAAHNGNQVSKAQYERWVKDLN
ncbi:hypothetical protein [Dyella nitratireducens]|uniref:Uncharacterized protein n=1 Tax=Dyella nitratireducens TaxID=1849580 RepID=A0ABQ1GL47_9GAMM|nr:hypothetical protein [Dyella nitratireducens]GGA45556.1 hypothetical protein GCM10010981_38330 [Dyella nitratireducens]GLQ41335.1 hypothetical protein GCM10007902_11850 [Dyella nitratireducens]